MNADFLNSYAILGNTVILKNNTLARMGIVSAHFVRTNSPGWVLYTSPQGYEDFLRK